MLSIMAAANMSHTLLQPHSPCHSVITERLVKIHATHCKVTRQAQARILQTCVFPAHTLLLAATTQAALTVACHMLNMQHLLGILHCICRLTTEQHQLQHPLLPSLQLLRHFVCRLVPILCLCTLLGPCLWSLLLSTHLDLLGFLRHLT